jgi:hypothetical protein
MTKFIITPIILTILITSSVAYATCHGVPLQGGSKINYCINNDQKSLSGSWSGKKEDLELGRDFVIKTFSQHGLKCSINVANNGSTFKFYCK